MGATPRSASEQDCASTLETVLRIFPTLSQDVVGKTVLYYGCGRGMLNADLAALASVVYAVDIRPDMYGAPQRNNVVIGTPAVIPSNVADVVISINAFEHYGEPESVLVHWREILKPGGKVYLSLGPPWFHPYGAHMYFFTRLPWIHLWCPERKVMSSRSRYRSDGAKQYEEVEGGLNRMSVWRCDRLLAHCGFRCVFHRNVPIRNIQWPHATSIRRELWTTRADRILSLD